MNFFVWMRESGESKVEFEIMTFLIVKEEAPPTSESSNPPKETAFVLIF